MPYLHEIYVTQYEILDMAWQKKFLWFQWLVETGKSALKRAVLETRSQLFRSMVPY